MDFASFYDKQPDYAAFREDPMRRSDYNIIADWKARNLVKLVPENFNAGNILEVGCAFGVLLNNIADRLQVKTRIGVDISGKSIDVANKLFPDCDFFQGTFDEFREARLLGNTDKRFDLVILSDIIEHVPDDLGFLKSVKNYSSYVLLNLPLEKSFSTRNRQYGEHDPSGHLKCYDKTLAVELVTDAGFEIASSFTATAFFDSQFYEVYKRNRGTRVTMKPLPMKIFWTVFYFLQDKVKLFSRSMTDKIYGTNYFALLKSPGSL
jgi:SAM-dependent methyltransferase